MDIPDNGEIVVVVKFKKTVEIMNESLLFTNSTSDSSSNHIDSDGSSSESSINTSLATSSAS